MSRENCMEVERNFSALSNNASISIHTTKSISDQIGLTELATTEFPIFFQPLAGKLPRNKPRELQAELQHNLSDKRGIAFIKFTRNDKLLCVANNIASAQELLRVGALLSVPVNSTIQMDGLTSRFLLHDIDADISLLELAEALEAENRIQIKEIRRFTRGPAREPTETVLVTSFGTTLPPAVKLWYTRHPIQLFYDRPRQCTNCFKFDHSRTACRSATICENCGDHHDGAPCPAAVPKCCNCNGEHKATDKACSKRDREAKLLKFKAEHHLTFAEARRRFTGQDKENSYAGIAKASTPQTTATFREDVSQQLQLILAETRASMRRIMLEQLEEFKALMHDMAQALSAALAQEIKSVLPALLQASAGTSTEDPLPRKE